MRILKFAVAAALLVLPFTQARASVLSNLLTVDGNPDQLLATSSRVNVIDQDGSGSFSLGDVVYGFIEVNTIDNNYLTDPGPDADVSPNTMAIVFSAEIDVATPGAPFDSYSLGAVDMVGNAGLDLASLLGPVAGSVASTDIFVLLESTSISPPATQGFTESSTAAPVAGGLAPAGTPDALANFGAGFDVALTGDASGLGEFFSFTDTGFGFGIQTGGFGVTSSPAFSPSTIFLGVPTSTSTPPSVPTGSSSDVALELTFVQPNGSPFGPPPVDGFGFTANATFTINATPEPVSLLVWGGIATSMICVRGRRHRS